jgi:hypothetical protein
MSFDRDDDVLIDGDGKAILAYAGDPKKVVIVDHRAEEEEMLRDFARHLPGLGYAFDEDGEKIELKFGGESQEVRLTFSPADRYIVIRALNDLLAPTHEIRVFRATLPMDTHSLLVRPRSWWQEMAEAFASRTGSVFAKLDEGMDFI